jgi:hypothetical protein
LTLNTESGVFCFLPFLAGVFNGRDIDPLDKGAEFSGAIYPIEVVFTGN